MSSSKKSEKELARQELEKLMSKIENKDEREHARAELEKLMASFDEKEKSSAVRKKRSIGNGRGIDDKLQAYTEREIKWVQAGSFLIQPTVEGVPVFTIHSMPGMPNQAFMVYNGGDHALLFRNKNLGMVLDYLNPNAKNVLNKATEAAICEVDPETNNMAPIYRIPLLHVDHDINVELSKQGE